MPVPLLDSRGQDRLVRLVLLRAKLGEPRSHIKVFFQAHPVSDLACQFTRIPAEVGCRHNHGTAYTLYVCDPMQCPDNFDSDWMVRSVAFAFDQVQELPKVITLSRIDVFAAVA